MRPGILSLVLAVACILPSSLLGGSGLQRPAVTRDPSAGAHVVDVVTAILAASATVSTRPGFYVAIKYASLGQILSGH